MCYNCVVKSADKDAGTFGDFRLLPATPVPPSEEVAIHHINEIFVKLDWTEIFKDTNHAITSDMMPISYTGEREREEVDVDITVEEINNMKDSNLWYNLVYICDAMVPSSF